MWYGLRASPKLNTELTRSATELLQSTSRTLILATLGILITCHILATGKQSAEVGLQASAVTLTLVIAGILALRILSKSLVTAQAIWQVGVAGSITLAIFIFRQPEVAVLYALLPLMSTITLGWPAGLLSEGSVLALVWWLTQTSALPPLSPIYALGISAGGLLTGTLGWAATRALLTVTEWSLYSYEQARQKMIEAHEQQMKLEEVQKDLLHANRELIRLSERLKAMHQIAEEARRTKEDFVANVSHELRTPLNMIIGFSAMVTQAPQVYGESLPPKLLADISAIRRNSLRLASLVDDVLDLSQIEAGRMALSKEWTSLQEIVGEATLALQALFESKGLALQVDVPSDLPQIFCDSTRTSQVVTNLLSNAARFTETGGVQIEVWRERDSVVVCVTDTGPGIAPQDQEELFQPFQQLGQGHGGSGLGLSISKQFVEMHGGEMWLESEEGTGTSVYFRLPIESPPLTVPSGQEQTNRRLDPYAQYEAYAKRSATRTPPVVPRYVLLEEGNTLQRLFSRYVDDAESVAVQTVEQASQELARSPAQALIVNTPSSNNVPVLLDQLGDQPYGTPTVLCWVPGEDEAAKRLGVVRYMVKPVSRDVLLSTLAELGEDIESVLLADNDPEILQLFTRMLSSAEHEYRITRARNGQRALDLMRARKPDVVLLDLIMPGLDGFRVLQEKAQDPSIRQIPAIVISSRDPANEPIASNTLTVTRSGGISVRNLLNCVQAVSQILAPAA